MKKHFRKCIAVILAIVLIGGLLSGCTEAERVNHNLNRQANYFDCERRVTVYNARTDKIILYIEDIGGTHTDPYHYKVFFDTNVIPSVEVK